MNIEIAIEFFVENQARADARFNAKFDRADERFRKAEARLGRLEQAIALNNRVVTRLVRYGVSPRSDVRRLNQEPAATERAFRRLAEAQATTDRALESFLHSTAPRNGRSLAGQK